MDDLRHFPAVACAQLCDVHAILAVFADEFVGVSAGRGGVIDSDKRHCDSRSTRVVTQLQTIQTSQVEKHGFRAIFFIINYNMHVVSIEL